MEFNPNNPIIQLCIQGMDMEEKKRLEEALKLFLQAWHEAGNDFERFTAAYYVARRQDTAADRLKWLQKALGLAESINDVAVSSALPNLYSKITQCYEEMGDAEGAARHREQSEMHRVQPADEGPFYHGTKADLKVGDFLTPGFNSNYKADLKMNHIYFTALPNGAGLAAALAAGDGEERVYIVEPTGSFENDPNVTDMKFPGNPTRSYRTDAPLKIIGELKDWARLPAEAIQKWRERLANVKGDIIN